MAGIVLLLVAQIGVQHLARLADYAQESSVHDALERWQHRWLGEA